MKQAQLKVVGGIHRGARVPVPDQSITLGSGDLCDVMLVDDDVTDTHCTIALNPKGCRIVACDAPVNLVGMGELEAGFQTDLALPVEFEIGNARLKLFSPTPLPPPRRRAAAKVPVFLAIAAALCFLPFSGLYTNQTEVGGADPAPIPDRTLAKTTTEDPQQTDQLAEQQEKPTKSAQASVVSQMSLEEIKSKLSAQLNERGLGDVDVQVGATELRAAGILPDTSYAAWNGVLDWFDSTYSDIVLIAEGISFRPKEIGHPPHPFIQSVWLIGKPYVVVKGNRVYPGDSLESGWLLNQVEKTHSEFSFGDHKVRVRYADAGAAAEE